MKRSGGQSAVRRATGRRAPRSREPGRIGPRFRPPRLHFAGLFLAALVLASPSAGQEIRVYSEFRRVDPFGELVPQDRAGRPREILSPLAARNSHATFRLVVETPPGKHYYLFVGSNPEEIFKIDVYKEMWRKEDQVWVPDRLLPVTTPYLSHVPDRYHGIPDQTVESFVMDLFVPADLAPGRYKLEPQVSCDDQWAVYPMEIRISDVIVPETRITGRRLPSAMLSADSVAHGPLREFLCGIPEKAGQSRDSVRALLRRNVLEDLALARAKEPELGKGEVANQLLRGLGMDVAAFCATDELNSPSGPEWFLPGRDLLYRGTLNWY